MWIIGIALLVIVGYLLDREVYFYEGVHLGPRLQAWLYDRWAKKYDEGKHTSQLRDEELLAKPLLESLCDVPEPFILDFATGTGRLSFALLSQAAFKGRILALDLSQGMLEQAATKLNESKARVDFLRHMTLPLPFPDAAFDAVCALEVLELFPNMDEPVRELTRVLRPGGVLLTSRGTEESGRKAKVKGADEFSALLEKHGMEQVQLTKWWKLFDRVMARKGGSLEWKTYKNLADVLTCSACQSRQWNITANAWVCQNCRKELPMTRMGILLN